MFAPDTRIMIVDDMLTMRKIIEKCLRELGFKQFSSFADGELAWPELQKAVQEKMPYQLVLSDWNMPKMKGVDLLRRVRAVPELKATPFILITAESEKGQIQEAIQANVSGYIVKPFSAARLEETIKRVHAQTQKAVAAA